eukprot:TRINITY_DN4943_c0_g3_i2.p1 TRINITY_DN4943_c0_g3~~TRINITY_DN4943_c0_g3_i2.p1  ORF type:complete len:191 (-),score=75.55 TRINITY_DN4943_c0_g3_i2:52-624(-)
MENNYERLDNTVGWFIFLIPDESTYENYDNDQIDYDVHLICLEKPILQWFKEVWQKPINERENYVNQSLKLDIKFNNITVFGLWTIIDDQFVTIPPPSVNNTLTLFEFIKQNLKVEGPISFSKYSFTAITNCEFDCVYSFFIDEALNDDYQNQDQQKPNGFIKYLKPLLLKREDGTIQLLKDKVTLSAYL